MAVFSEFAALGWLAVSKTQAGKLYEIEAGANMTQDSMASSFHRGSICQYLYEVHFFLSQLGKGGIKCLLSF